MTHYDVSHNMQWWTYAQPLTISVRSFITVYAIIVKSIRSTHGHYEDNLQIILATWEWDKSLNTKSNIQQIDTTFVGRKDTGPQFSPSVPPTPFNESSKTYAKGPQLVSPFLHPVLCSTTFSAILLSKGWRSVYGYKGHQTLAYLLHIIIASWKQCFNSWLHWCHSVKSQQNTSDQGINPVRFLSLSIFWATFIHYSWHLIMTCVVHANIA